MPMDYNAALKASLVRRPANFISTISDDRGEELVYGNMVITEVFEKDIGIGGVLSILWFKKLLPRYATKFIDMTIMVTADHSEIYMQLNQLIMAPPGHSCPALLLMLLLPLLKTSTILVFMMPCMESWSVPAAW